MENFRAFYVLNLLAVLLAREYFRSPRDSFSHGTRTQRPTKSKGGVMQRGHANQKYTSLPNRGTLKKWHWRSTSHQIAQAALSCKALEQMHWLVPNPRPLCACKALQAATKPITSSLWSLNALQAAHQHWLLPPPLSLIAKGPLFLHAGS